MAGKQDNEYLLGTHDDELDRLGFQHRVWSEHAFQIWQRAGFGPGQCILDLGCGPGFASFDLAGVVGPTGRVIAVDESARFLNHLSSQARAKGITNIRVRRADVHALDLSPASLDGAYARWVLCFVRDPQAVIRAVARALRPGGALAAMDYFNYHAFTFAPRSAALDRVVRAVSESWLSHGGDLDIMLAVPRMMESAGLEVKDVRPIVRVATPGSALWNWPWSFFRNYLPALVAGGFLSDEERRVFETEWEKRSSEPTSYLCTPPMLEVIAVKR